MRSGQNPPCTLIYKYMYIYHFSMNMIKSRLLGRSTLGSTIIGVVPKDQKDEVGMLKVVFRGNFEAVHI